MEALSPGLSLGVRGRHCRLVRVSSSSVVQNMPDPGFFPRDRELKGLKEFVRKSGGFLLLTGPPDCGKTAILRKLASDEKGVTWIDMRGGEFTTADKFTQKVGAQLQGASLVDNIGLEFNWSFVTVSINKEKDPIEFHEALFNYLKVRKEKAEKAGTSHVPTIILDEANDLQRWHGDEASQKALQSMLGFFVKVTKQERLANIIMATSEYFFKFWLEKKIGASRFSKAVIGDFTEAEARGFLDYMLGYSCSDLVWKDVYKLYGGRALLLERFATYSDADDWTDYLEELYDNAYEEVWQGLEPEILEPRDVPICWNSKSYMQIMKELCKHEDGVMSWEDLVALPFCSPKVAKELICYNLLHCRTRSKLAQDLAWYKGTWPIVMPMSRAHLAAMKNIVDRSKAKV